MIEAYLKSYGPSVIGGAIFLVAAWLFAIWADRALRYLLVQRLKVDPAVGAVASRTARISIIVLAVIAVLDELGVEIASLIAALGIFGFAIAIGLRTTSTNFFTGLTILVLKPYRIGEYIDGERVEGVVESISVFHTVLVSPEGVYIAVPNGAMWARSVKNFSRPRPRRLELDITLARSKPFEEFSSVIEETLRADTGLHADFPPLLRVGTVTEKELKLNVTVWCSPARVMDAKERLSASLRSALTAVGVEVLSIRTPRKPRARKPKVTEETAPPAPADTSI
jgi:small conductance mechanosensitive channel